MTKFTLTMIDVEPALNAYRQPDHFIDRPLAGGDDRPAASSAIYENAIHKAGRTGTFFVPISALISEKVDEPIKWTRTNYGEAVHVPLCAYRTLEPTEACILATGLEMGVRASLSLLPRLGRATIVEVTLVVGRTCVPLPLGHPDSYRCWIGFAFRVSENHEHTTTGSVSTAGPR